jgi:hypothetical protein
VVVEGGLPCVKVARSCLSGCELGGDMAEGDAACDFCDVRVLEEEEGYLATSLVSYPYPDLEMRSATHSKFSS